MPENDISNPDSRPLAETVKTVNGDSGPNDVENDEIYERVEDALDTIRPAIAQDGGNVEVLDIEDGVVTLRMMGACGGCPMSTMTLKHGIEQRLREMVPGIVRVDAI